MMMMMEPHCNKYFSRENKIEIKEMCDCIKIIVVGIHILVDSRSQPTKACGRMLSITTVQCHGRMKIGNANIRDEMFEISK